MESVRMRLNYGNVVATIALFLALGGVSLAAIQIPRNSVGSGHLKKNAVSTVKIRNGAITEEKIANYSITTSKLADGAVVGTKVDSSSLGPVPNAAFALRADHADRADTAKAAAEAEGAWFAYKAKDAGTLGNQPAGAYGGALVARTSIPATSSAVELWAPISGLSAGALAREDVEMVLPVPPRALHGTGFTAYSEEGPSGSGAARVSVDLYVSGKPAGLEMSVEELSSSHWGPGVQVNIPQGAQLAIKITEEPNGEEIPAMDLQTALWLSPSLLGD